MSRVSSNAGKHPYLRTDLDLFSNIVRGKGITIDFSIKPKFDCNIQTEYVDKNGKVLSYRDVVKYNNEEYTVDYDSRNYYWSLKKDEKTLKLSDFHKKCELKKTK